MLLNTTKYPLLGIKIFDGNGKKVKIKPRCELCAFVDVVGDEMELVCTKLNIKVFDNAKCDEWNITMKMMDDIYSGCIK